MVFRLDDADRQALLERFLRYVKVDTQSDDNATTSPSTEKQKDLARMLARELTALGCEDVKCDDYGYVYAAIPENLGNHVVADKTPTIALIAHLDTYPGTPGGGVKPNVIESYSGGTITLPGNPALSLTVADNPNLSRCIGHTLVTTDGTTLLGADDKAGVAEIMTMVAWLKDHPEFHHGRVRIAFTPDEEVGRGTEHFDVEGLGAHYAYTLDGSDLGEVEDETFCADAASIIVDGYDVHPGYGKGKLKNAIRAAAAIIDRLPTQFLPETTDGREPYLHPIDIRGDVTRVEVKLLLRAFTEEELRAREMTLRDLAAGVETDFPGVHCTVTVKESYRNMAYQIREDPKVLNYAMEAIRRQGLTPIKRAIRGGTDGARLSFMGVLTPNLWAGGQSFHSVREWVSLDWMAQSVETTIQILAVWVDHATDANA